MDSSFKKPDNLIGRFAVVKLWPEIKAAEDENIARLKVTASSLGLECIEITPDARSLVPPHAKLTRADVDFVIHLHFETPKAYDLFSFVALWNPVQFYHDWGYRRFSRHLLTHDDFLSCSSIGTDDHVCRMIAGDPTRRPPRFTMYHSLSEPILEPTLGEKKIFYAGINWERLGKKRGRHQELLKRLDPTGLLSIYGPDIFQGVNVWKGYRSYMGSIPFDGISILREINRCGIALVLSSDAHKQSQLMSNRLFESLAAGAFLICDENPFAERYLGDTALYIDTTAPTDEVFKRVTGHVEWVRSHPAQALEMIRKAQDIFRQRFSLEKSLINIYANLNDRRQCLERLYAPSNPDLPVTLLLLMPTYEPQTLDRHIASVKTQRHAGCHAVLLIDEGDLREHGAEIRRKIGDSGARIDVRPVVYREVDEAARLRRHVRLGEIISDAIKRLDDRSLFCVVAPDEELFAEHIQSLVGALERDPQAAVAYSHLLYRCCTNGKTVHELREDLNCLSCTCDEPLGFGRLLFRRSAFGDVIHSALRYLDAGAVSLLLAACSNRAKSNRASMIADIRSSFNVGLDRNVPGELEVIRDYCPDLEAINHNGAATASLDELEPKLLSLKRLSDMNRQAIAVDLAQSIPLPSMLKKIVFGAYRRWLRRTR